MALSSLKCALASGPRTRAAGKLLSRNREFHASGRVLTFHPAWMDMRVKTPWIDALAKSKQVDNNKKVADREIPKPDLTPKKMSDSYYTAVILP
jgi:acyl-coenzyme A thioesterase 9